VAYLSLFVHDAHHDDGVTVPEHASNSPSCKNPIGMGKVPLMTPMTLMTMKCRGSLKVMHPSLLRRETVLGAGSLRSAKATKSDAGVKLGVPTSSRTSLPARIEIAVPLGL
jgi:hypothetical protein